MCKCKTLRNAESEITPSSLSDLARLSCTMKIWKLAVWWLLHVFHNIFLRSRAHNSNEQQITIFEYNIQMSTSCTNTVNRLRRISWIQKIPGHRQNALFGAWVRVCMSFLIRETENQNQSTAQTRKLMRSYSKYMNVQVVSSFYEKTSSLVSALVWLTKHFQSYQDQPTHMMWTEHPASQQRRQTIVYNRWRPRYSPFSY